MNLEQTRNLLAEFKFHELFVEQLGWSQPTSRRLLAGEEDGMAYHARMISQLAGVAVFEIWADSGLPDAQTRKAIERDISRQHRENLCIFLDSDKNRTQSFWVWANRERDDQGRLRPVWREHSYFRGQPADLFLGKLQAMVFELADFSEKGNLTVIEVARRMKAALDVERVTRKFYNAYQDKHRDFLAAIEGIEDDRERQWYASIILNRLMFIWFLQKKLFLDVGYKRPDQGDADYLVRKLAESKARGPDRFFGEFLKALFFEAFAKPNTERSEEAKAMTGNIRFLNGGLFLPHRLEYEADSKTLRLGTTLRIPDAAFESVFDLFAGFSWNLDDAPGGASDEINPDVLGYIFEKYINQKAFGAYYTRTEITGYLCEHAIYGIILDRVRQPAMLDMPAVEFATVPEMLARMDARLAIDLAERILPSLKLLDPAVGSGAFLVAAMKVLINIYTAIVGRAKMGASRELENWITSIEREHRNVAYYIRRRIITDNLFGVDIMEEATEIAKLRLFLALVASARSADELEPLPNIDFNIMAGNSLLGLMRVDEHEMDHRQDGLFDLKYRDLLNEKNRLVDLYRSYNDDPKLRGDDLAGVKREIDALDAIARPRLTSLLRDQFEQLGIRYEEATWDSDKKTLGKFRKRQITEVDIEADHPFHWGYEFSSIVQGGPGRPGGFDAIITNPPWEIFKSIDKEFAKTIDANIERRGTSIKEFAERFKGLLKDASVRRRYLDYLTRFPHISAYYRAAPQYSHQSVIVNGKKTGGDINLYKLFTEQCYNLLKPGGRCGIVIPSGIYSDLGTKGLRDLLFDHTRIEGLFVFENRKALFEGVDSRFKFVVLNFEKLPPQAAGERGTRKFHAAFMRHDVEELARFPEQGAIEIDVDLVRRLSPDSHSIMEFKSTLDVQIAEKMLRHPLLGEEVLGAWNLSLTREFDMTNDSNLFKTAPGAGRLPLYEGRMIWHFEHGREPFRYWVEEKAAYTLEIEQRTKKINRQLQALGAPLAAAYSLTPSYSFYRLGFRTITGATNERALVVSVLPKNVVTGNSLTVSQPTEDHVNKNGHEETILYTPRDLLCFTSIMSCFVCDWFIRQQILTNMNMFYVYQIPVPRLSTEKINLDSIINRAARLICTTPDFDQLAAEVGLGSHKAGVTDPGERARLRAEIDGLVAHLYGLTEAEFAHILTTFPLVTDAVKLAARNAYRDVERGLLT